MLTSFLFLFLIRARSPNSRRSFRNLLSPFSLRIASSTSFKYRLPLFLDDDSNYFAINDGSFAAAISTQIGNTATNIRHGSLEKMSFCPLVASPTDSTISCSRGCLKPLLRIYLRHPLKTCIFTCFLCRFSTFKSSPSGNCSCREKSRTLYEKEEKREESRQSGRLRNFRSRNRISSITS